MVVFFEKVMKIPTQKGKQLSKCTELSLKQKEGVLIFSILAHSLR